jgi:hypothetical protein
VSYYVNHYPKVLFQCMTPECRGYRRDDHPRPTCIGTATNPHPEARMKAVEDDGQEETPGLIDGAT